MKSLAGGKWMGMLFLGLLLGCQSKDRLVVYADPWAGDFTTELVEYFCEVEDCEAEIRILSSEVILQHLHFGQPIDLVVLLDSSLIGEMGMRSELGAWQQFAEAKVQRVSIRGVLNKGIPGAGGTVLEASHRPVRRATEHWLGTQRPDSVIIGNFFKQTRDYLLRAWVKEGYVLEVLPRQFPDQLRVLDDGPAVPGGFGIALPKSGRRPDLAEQLADFWGSEKSRELLAHYHLIP